MSDREKGFKDIMVGIIKRLKMSTPVDAEISRKIGSIYGVIPSEFRRKKVFKVGATENEPRTRLYSYGRGTLVVCIMMVEDAFETEKVLLKKMREHDMFMSRFDIGMEYFEYTGADEDEGVSALQRVIAIAVEHATNPPEEAQSSAISDVTHFLEDCCENGPEKLVSNLKLLGVYNEWADKKQGRQRLCVKSLPIEMARKGFNKTRVCMEGSRNYVYRGLDLYWDIQV